MPPVRQEPELEDGEGSEQSEMWEEGQDVQGAEGEMVPQTRRLAGTGWMKRSGGRLQPGNPQGKPPRL